jgi:hypothetical protein
MRTPLFWANGWRCVRESWNRPAVENCTPSQSRAFFPATLVCSALLALLLSPQSLKGQSQDLFVGNLMQFDDNGIWTWYSDERAVIDQAGGKLVVGCVENAAGLGGIPRDGNINVSIFDMQTLTGTRWTLRTNLTSFGGGDDHNAPALLVMTNGHYLALYTGHNQDSNTWYRIYDPVAVGWSPEAVYDWGTQPGGTDFRTTYSNPNNMPAENRVYNFARSNGGGSPNCIISTDFGTNWVYGGELTTNDIPGYVQGYFKYWGNSVDRIDFICTEAHPRDYDTSMYHGYISNAMSFDSFGTLMDTNILDKMNIPNPQSFTPVFLAGTVMPPGQTNYRCWNDDVCRYPDGSIECIISARINNNVDSTNAPDTSLFPDHAFFFCRFDPLTRVWTPTYLCQAGQKLYSSECDYVGLGCLCPDDPNTIYISTTFDPRRVQPGVFDTNHEASTVHEIWRGVTTNHGAGFAWMPVTQNSSRDNFRPIVPAWDSSHTLLLWFRGTYNAAQSVDAIVLAVREDRSEVVGQKTYADALGPNATTTLANGSPLVTGAGVGQWHLQSVGNGGSLLSSADSVSEHAPGLLTQATVPQPGTYDVWVNFWGNPGTNQTGDWRIQAGLATNTMQVYRARMCKTVDPADYASNAGLVLTNAATNFFYQAYVGRLMATNTTLRVFVGDYAYPAGSTNLGNSTTRTWYDGIGYAKVAPFQITGFSYDAGGTAATVTWNSPRPGTTLTPPSYTLQKKHLLSDPGWTTVATGIPSGGWSTTNVDFAASGDAAFYRVTWP